MGILLQDRRLLWTRSGNQCSFLGCNEELVSQEKGNLSNEAHIKGARPGSKRYDPNQPENERDSYENLILLCGTHHIEIDNNAEIWTVEKLLRIKKEHEQEIIDNRQFPQIKGELLNVLRNYIPEIDDAFSLSNINLNHDSPTIKRVPASKESGINTNIFVNSGQKVIFFSTGLISYDGKQHFATPEGILCNEYGIPFVSNETKDNRRILIFPHEDAYKTIGGEIGRVGSLIGWIDLYSEAEAFLIGTKKEIIAKNSGFLHLLVNDAKGTYDDNSGEYYVEILLEKMAE